ncbi:MAG: hypothetical protein ACU83V_02150 [Gammaproteobacteria bacterium]
MQKKYHMHDQVKNKVEAVMSHYHRPMMDFWLCKLALMGGCFMLGVYWRSLTTILG